MELGILWIFLAMLNLLAANGFIRLSLTLMGLCRDVKAGWLLVLINKLKGKDYKHTFSPVAKFTTIRIILAVAAACHMEIHQLDINNAFLHGFIEEDLYMQPPLGYNKIKPGQVCKLNCSIYGLKQASRQLNLELTKSLLSLGFIQSVYDYSMFTLQHGNTYTIVVAYVDDLLVAGTHLSQIQHLKDQLHAAFTIKYLGPLKYLGIEVIRDSASILLNQRKYILDFLHNTDMSDCKAAACPFPQGLKLSKHDGDLMTDPELYRRIMGKLLYLNMTRPAISFICCSTT